MNPVTSSELDFWKRYSAALYDTPRAWAHKGEKLVHAFEAVVAATDPSSMHLNMDEQALMLAGMAAEVQIKAILISDPEIKAIVTGTRSSSPLKRKREIQKTFFSHNLSALADLVNLTMSAKQRFAADALSQYIYWRGRYVVPTDKGITDFFPVILANGLTGQAHRIAIEAARDFVGLVIAEVKRRLY